MAKAARTSRPGISYVTATTRERRPIFEISRVADLFIDTLLHYRTQGHYKLHAYVVMPDHIHLLLTPQSITLDQAVALIKTGFAYRLDSALPVWQDGYTAYSIANLHDLEQVRGYLHQLPVRANLVSSAQLYPHSSAYHLTPAAALPILLSAPRPPHSERRATGSAERSSQKSPRAATTSIRKSAS